MNQIDDKGEGALQQAARATAAEPVVSALRDGIANAWLIEELETGIAKLQKLVAEEQVFSWRRYWDGYHTAYADLLNKVLAQGMAARSGETGTGSTRQGNSPVACDAPNPHQGGHNEGTH